MADARELLRIADLSAGLAARLLVERSTLVRSVGRKSTAMDLVTDADLAAEAAIRATVLRHRPDDAILGEERGETPGSTSVRWVVDALDGTVNYVAGISDWAVSIAAEDLTRGIVAGVVRAPALGLAYSAVQGAGAWCDGVLLRSSEPAEKRLEDCVVATGFAADRERRAVQVAQLARVLPSVRDVRCRGAASLELCAVAAGEADAYFESDLAPWDVAAGRLIAVEAGATVIGDDPLSCVPLIAGQAPIVQQLGDLLRRPG